MISLLQKKVIFLFLFLFVPLMISAQSVPNQSAPVNGSTWETTAPTLYWWYLSNPYSIGPFNFSVQVSTNATDFSGSFLVVDATVSAGTAGSYAIPSSAGISVGAVYYWRVGVGGNYSAVWSFTPSSWGWGGGGGGTYYLISASAGSNGSISPSGSVYVASGTDQTFTINPSAGYEISDVKVDNVSVGTVSSYAFTNVTSDHTIAATFQLAPVMTYVAITGDDMNGDGSSANPYRTIQRGLNQTDPGGIVFVYNGNYEEDIHLTKPVTLLGEANPSTSSMIVRANNVTIKNFNVYAKPGSGPGPGIQKVGLETYDYLEYLTLENVQCYNNDEQGLLIENMGYVTIKNSRFFDNQMGGIGLAFCNNVTIENVGLEGNLRGMWAHGSSDLTISLVYVEDNGKIYPYNYPDQNGFTFTECENISITTLYSNRNEEQGFKFEDCSFITLEDVSASDNKTDGMAFINCTEITYNGGFANDNGEAAGDNGAEFVKCTNFTLNDFSANDNYDKGIYLGTRYTGQYQFDWTNPANSLRSNEFIGMCADVTFENVSADGNLNGDGLNIVHTSYGTFNNLSMTNNQNGAGLYLDASHHMTFTDGVFDHNNTGVFFFPGDHDHTPSHNIAQEEIMTLTFQGTVSASENTLYGMMFLTGPDVYPGPPVLDSPDPKIVEPFFNGDFSLFDNGSFGMIMEGKVIAPSFYGMYFKDATGSAGGFAIGTDPLSGNEPEDILINNSIFEGYANAPGRFAITLGDLTPATKDVDARYNIFAGATNAADVENLILHQVDNPALGLVDFSGWTSGKSVFYIGSASAYTGSMVTIPVTLNQPVYPESFNELKGTFDYNSVNLAFRYATTGTGTLLHDAGWSVIFDNSVANQLDFWAIGFSAISTSGTLFYLTFEIIDTNDGAETIGCDPLALYADNVSDLFVVHDGTINYTANTSVSLERGDATLDFAVDLGDYIAVVNHINGNLLTGQGLLNADVNSDGFVNALDAAAILAFIDHGVWPNAPESGDGDLLFASASVDQNGLLRFPFTISQAENVRSFEIELTYDESKVDFRNYVQLLLGDNYRVDANKVSEGKARFIFTASDESDGYLVPAEIMFNILGNPNSQITIHSSYSINGGEFQKGPDYTASGVTGVEREELPENFSVSQNYPNPFNPSTYIEYQIPEKGFVSIKIYDILGRLVKTLVNTELNAGYYKTTWNSVDNFGRKVSSGIYLYRVENGANAVTKKMILLK